MNFSPSGLESGDLANEFQPSQLELRICQVRFPRARFGAGFVRVVEVCRRHGELIENRKERIEGGAAILDMVTELECGSRLQRRSGNNPDLRPGPGTGVALRPNLPLFPT